MSEDFDLFFHGSDLGSEILEDLISIIFFFLELGNVILSLGKSCCEGFNKVGICFFCPQSLEFLLKHSTLLQQLLFFITKWIDFVIQQLNLFILCFEL